MSSNIITLQGKEVSLLDIRRNEGGRFPRIKDYPIQEAEVQLSKIILNAYLYKGQTADEQNIRFISTNLLRELLANKKVGAQNITFQEIAYAVKKAILGDSEVFGISVASLYKIIIAYINGEGYKLQEEVRKQRAKEENGQISAAIQARLQAAAGQLLTNNKI